MNKILYEDIYDKDNQFSFWKNWQQFLSTLNEDKLQEARNYLSKFIGWEEVIKDKTIVDFWCWSGLMSLCFILLWAKKVLSVDIDDSSIECAKFLRKKYDISEDIWEIRKWSILDKQFVSSLWTFDIVYSWGVIHHSWDMWRGLSNICTLVKDKQLLYVALYNKFDWFPSSNLWFKIKKYYSQSNSIIKRLLEFVYMTEIILMRILRWHNPISYIREYFANSNRWMDFYTDIKDWLGWYPYEFASIKEVESFYAEKWFKLINLYDLSYGTWCNEFLFQKL